MKTSNATIQPETSAQSEPQVHSSAGLAALVVEWRASAASHAKSLRGWAEHSTKLTAMHRAKYETYAYCAARLSEALKAANEKGQR